MGEWRKTLVKRIIRLSISCLDNKEKKAVLDVLDKEYLGMGEEVKEFEIALSSFFNRSAICVVNGTYALQLALQSIGIQTGVHYFPNHLLTKYRSKNFTSLPITEEIFPELLTLPLHPDLNENDIVFVCNELLNAINQEI